MNQERLEVASVVVVVQAGLLLVAALIAVPFGIVEPGYRVLALLTLVTAGAMFWFARHLRRGRAWARRWLLAFESLSLLASLLLTVLPVGAMRGVVPVMVNLVLPATVIWLLWSTRQVARRSDALDAAGGRGTA